MQSVVSQVNSIRVLLVEDNPIDVRIVQHALRRSKEFEYELLAVPGLTQAQQIFIGSTNIDVVLLDLNLADSTAENTLHTACSLFSDVPVVFLTGLMDQTLISRALAAGAQDYVIKEGANPGEIERAIRYAIERKRSEASLRASELRLQQFVRNVPVIVWSADAEGNATFSDGKGLESLRLQPGEMVGQNLLHAYANSPEIMDNLYRALRGEAFSATNTIGSVEMYTQFTPKVNRNGESDGFDALSVDITEQLTAQREIARQRELLQLQAERLKLISRISAVVVGQHGLQEIGNRSVEKVREVFQVDMCVVRVLRDDHLDLLACSGLARDDVPQTIPVNFGLAEIMTTTRKPVTIKDVRENSVTAPFTKAPKGLHFLSFAGSPLYVGDRLIGVLGIYSTATVREFTEDDLSHLEIVANNIAVAIYNDQLFQEAEHRREQLETQIQERMRVEEALRESEYRFRRIFESNMLGIYFSRFDGTITQANDAFLNMTGYTIEDVANGSLNWHDMTPADCATVDERALSELRQHGVCPPFEKAYLHKDQRRIPVIVGTATLDAKGESGVVFVLDISERKATETLIQTHISQMNALRTVDMAISASLDLRISLNILLEQVIDNLNVDAASVLLLNRHDQTLSFAAGRGFNSDALKHTKLRLGEGYAGRAAVGRRIIAIEDLNSQSMAFQQSVHFRDEQFVAYFAVPLMAKGQVEGVLEVFKRAPIQSTKEWHEFLDAISGQAAIAINNSELFSQLERSNAQLALAYDTTLEGWSRALDLRDRETEGHTQRVTEMSEKLARLMGLSDEEIIHIRRGALLHDIGKMGIPDSILHKPGPLSHEEWEIMQKHPTYAFQLLSPIDYLRPALDIPYCHHEKWDGSGYPRKLRGEQIPLAARIFAVVDVWDALTSDRPYRQAWSVERARNHIIELSGAHFEPKVVDAFLALDI